MTTGLGELKIGNEWIGTFLRHDKFSGRFGGHCMHLIWRQYDFNNFEYMNELMFYARQQISAVKFSEAVVSFKVKRHRHKPLTEARVP